MPSEKIFMMYAAYGNAANMEPVYTALEEAGCKLEIYKTHVPGYARLGKPHGRDPTQALSLMEGELTIVHAPPEMTHRKFKGIVNPIDVGQLVDVFYPKAKLRHKSD